MSNNNTSKANAVTTKTTTKTVEDKIRQYAALFNGTERDFSVAEPIFNDVYHESFLGTVSSGGRIDKKAKRKLDEQRLAAGARIINVLFTRIDHNKALVEFYLENEEKAISISSQSQYLVTIKDTKVIEAQYVDCLAGIIKAYYLSDYHSLKRVKKYITELPDRL